jgi:hypothetical protein
LPTSDLLCELRRRDRLGKVLSSVASLRCMARPRSTETSGDACERLRGRCRHGRDRRASDVRATRPPLSCRNRVAVRGDVCFGHGCMHGFPSLIAVYVSSRHKLRRETYSLSERSHNADGSGQLRPQCPVEGLQSSLRPTRELQRLVTADGFDVGHFHVSRRGPIGGKRFDSGDRQERFAVYEHR